MDSNGDFGFGFNDPNFSDRLLRLEITQDDEDGCVRVRKRRREYDEEVITTTHESQSSYVRVEKLHINSLILAAKSPFFHKLFSNGMRESEQRHATLRIEAYEETAVIDLLRFMYNNNSLSAIQTPALLDVLRVADKFQVDSCIKYCTGLLLKIPMTFESSLLLLDLPSPLSMVESIQPLRNAAAQFLVSRYKDLKIPPEEAMALPLFGIKAILLRDDLHVSSEDIVYETAIEWAKLHYSDLEQRQEILGSHLARYIRFPRMTCTRLMKILTTNDFKPHVANELVLQALNYKAEPSEKERRILGIKQTASHYHWCVGREAYTWFPVKTVVFESPRHQCVAYWDLTRKECEIICPSTSIKSQTFDFGGHELYLLPVVYMDQISSSRYLGLLIGVKQGEGPVSVDMDCEFSVRLNTTFVC